MVNPESLLGILTRKEAEAAREAAESFGGRDNDRLERARKAFSD